MTDILTRERIEILRKEDQFFELCAYDFHALIATALAYHDALAKLDRLTVVIAERDAEIARLVTDIESAQQFGVDTLAGLTALTAAAREAEKVLNTIYETVRRPDWEEHYTIDDLNHDLRKIGTLSEPHSLVLRTLRAALPPEPDHQSISEGE